MTKKESKAVAVAAREQINVELDKAIASVTGVKLRTDQLHRQWRSQLQRLSCLVMLLSLHQFSQPALQCVNDVNAHEGSQSLRTTIQLVMGHSMMEAMGVIISFLLFQFTSMNDPAGDFMSQSYVAAASLIPICAGMFIHVDYSLTCLGETQDVIMEEFGGSVEVKRSIPVAIVFHVIVSACYWFMKLGKGQCDNQVDAMMRLKTELGESKSKQEKKKIKWWAYDRR